MKCNFCGTNEATETILNPNINKKEDFWDVCGFCKDYIKEKQFEHIQILLNNRLKEQERRL